MTSQKEKNTETSSFSGDEKLGYALAYERNAATFAAALARAGGGLVQHEPDYLLALFPHPHSINGVFLPRFDPANCAERIDGILEIARLRKIKIRFRLGPSHQPPDLAERLIERGVRKSVTQKLMAISLGDDSPLFQRSRAVESPADLSIYPIRDYAILTQKTHPRLGKINTPFKRALVSAYQTLADQSPRCHWTFIAELNDQIVASVGIFFHQESVVGYDLLVQKEYRRIGIGTAMLRQIGSLAAGSGASKAVLATSVQGLRFYPVLGIRSVGEYPIYSYKP